MADYPPPLDRLLTLGRPSELWPDYLALGIGPKHVPGLMRMAIDADLLHAEDENRFFGRIHAWQALGQLHAVEAAETLTQAMEQDRADEMDWAGEEMPDVFALLGPTILPTLIAYLAEPTHDLYVRWQVATGIRRIAEEHPEARPACVEALVQQLERAAENPPELNGGLVGELLDLQAVEATPAMERAFAGEHVDEFICGDWEKVRFQLGLGPDEPPPRYHDPVNRTISTTPPSAPAPPASAGPAARTPQERAQARRKQARKDRKRNRRKK